jgi:hypothetical protein
MHDEKQRRRLDGHDLIDVTPLNSAEPQYIETRPFHYQTEVAFTEALLDAPIAPPAPTYGECEACHLQCIYDEDRPGLCYYCAEFERGGEDPRLHSQDVPAPWRSRQRVLARESTWRSIGGLFAVWGVIMIGFIAGFFIYWMLVTLVNP